jgi:hypothetical protein
MELVLLVVMVVMEQRLLSQALLLLTLVEVAAVYLVAQLVEQEVLAGVVMVEVAHQAEMLLEL